jgi:hypothetical protein
MEDQIHDTYVDLRNEVPSRVEVLRMVSKVPEDIKLLADQWGWGDTEVGDALFRWMKQELGLNNNV